MPAAAHFARLVLLGAATAAFLVPGWLLGRIFRTPFAWVTSFLGSAALLFNLILVLDALRMPLDLFTVGCAYAAVAGLIAIWAVRRSAFPSRLKWQPPEMPRRLDCLWLLPPALALASIAARAVLEPLSGYDNAFRWNYLAKLIFTRHSLAGYPPIRMEDFDLYSWCDGIPPLVPFLNFLIYAVAGTDAPPLISIRAVSEFVLLAALTYRFARDFWGRDAGWPSLAVLGSSALLIWGLSIEQETGLTAIALVAMIYFITRAPDESAATSALWAGVAAGVGAISREYGMYFVILGAVLLFASGRRRTIAWFLAPAVSVASPWYLRNWIVTGNPVYPAMGRIFPTNLVHVEIMRDIGGFMKASMSPFPLGAVLTALLATAGVAGILGFAGLIRAKSRALGILSAILLIAALWIWSIPLTAGGWNYSMRVLLPAVALAAVLGGWIGAARGRVRAACALLLALVSVDSARRAWLLPDFPSTSPWTLSFSEWRQLRAQDDRPGANFWTVLVKVAGRKFIVVDTPNSHAAVTAAGGHATPFMSPRFAPALDPSLPADEAIRRLRALDVRFVTFSVRNPVVNVLIQRHPTLRQLAEDYAPVASIRGLLIFDLEFLSRKQGGNGPP